MRSGIAAIMDDDSAAPRSGPTAYGTPPFFRLRIAGDRKGVTIYDVAGRRAELLLLHGVRPLAAELERWRAPSDRRIPAGKSWRSHLGI